MGFSFSILCTPVFSPNQSASVCMWEKFFDADKPLKQKHRLGSKQNTALVYVSAVHFSAEQWCIKLNRVVLSQTAVLHSLDATIF